MTAARITTAAVVSTPGACATPAAVVRAGVAFRRQHRRHLNE